MENIKRIAISKNGVTLTLQSSYGSYGYVWGNIGLQHPCEFLAKISDEYVLDKLIPREQQTCFNKEKLIEGMGAHLKREAAARNISGNCYMDALAELQLFAGEFLPSFESACAAYEDGDWELLKTGMGGEYFVISDLAGSSRVRSPATTGFLENIWGPLQSRFKELTNQLKAPVTAGV